MAAALTLIETPTKLTYTGVGANAGYSIVIAKNDQRIEVHQIVPVEQARGETWSGLRDRFSQLLEPQ